MTPLDLVPAGSNRPVAGPESYPAPGVQCVNMANGKSMAVWGGSIQADSDGPRGSIAGATGPVNDAQDQNDG